MILLLEPQERRTSEVRYHSDLAPGRRFVFTGRVIHPAARLYIVGRQVEHVPADQPEWLDDHRHNCPTFYVLIGRNADLTGLAGEIVIERRAFLAESPCAIMLPAGYLHHHRLTHGGGWSLHVNTRPDYEESLLEGDHSRPRPVDLAQVYRPAEPHSGTAVGWELGSGFPGTVSMAGLPIWKFIDPEDFTEPGVRLHAALLSPAAGDVWAETTHAHDGDEAAILLPLGSEPLSMEARGETDAGGGAPGLGGVAARAPAAFYATEHSAHRLRYAAGTGLLLKFLRLPWNQCQ